MSRSRHHGCACGMCSLDNKAELKRSQFKTARRDQADGVDEYDDEREERE